MQTYYVEVDNYKTVRWYNNATEIRLLHRVDGPAIEDAYGYKEWCLNGQRHRVDGPAIEDVNGYKAWYLHGQLHRVDGPAIENADGRKEWYLNGQKLSEADHKATTSKTPDPCDGKLVEFEGKKYKLTAV